MGIKGFTERVLSNALNLRTRRKRNLKPAGLGLGWEVSDPTIPFGLSPELRLRHTYILGSTGCGKTNFLSQLILQDIEDKTTVAILDMRGDLIDRILSEPAFESIDVGRIHIIDLRKPSASSGINPFQCTSDPYSAALQILSILRSSAESWGVQIDETMRCSLIALSVNRRSVADLAKFLTDDAFRQSLLQKVEDELVLAFFERYDTFGAERQLQWVMPVLNKVSPFLSHPSIRSILADQEPINLRKVLDTKGSVFLVALAVDRLHGMAGTFGALVVSAIENAVMQRVDCPEQARNPVYLYLDEFENFQSSAFESIIAEGRRFRLGLTLSHQNLHQLDLRLRHTITNNAATRIYFRTGQSDASVLASELESFGVSNSKSSLMRLPVGEAWIISEGREARHVRFREAKRPKNGPKVHTSTLEALEARARPFTKSADVAQKSARAVQHLRPPRAAQRKGVRDREA